MGGQLASSHVAFSVARSQKLGPVLQATICFLVISHYFYATALVVGAMAFITRNLSYKTGRNFEKKSHVKED